MAIDRLVRLLRDNGIECDPANTEQVVEKVVFNFNLQKRLKDAWRKDAEALKEARRVVPIRVRRFGSQKQR